MTTISLRYTSPVFDGIAPEGICAERLDNGWRPVIATLRRNPDGMRFVDITFETGEDAWEWMNHEGFDLDEIEARVR